MLRISRLLEKKYNAVTEKTAKALIDKTTISDSESFCPSMKETIHCGAMVERCPEIKRVHLASTSSEEKNVFATVDVNQIKFMGGCKVMYKIDSGGRREYNKNNLPRLRAAKYRVCLKASDGEVNYQNFLSLEASEYQVYLRVDGERNYYDILYNNSEAALTINKKALFASHKS